MKLEQLHIFGAEPIQIYIILFHDLIKSGNN